MKHMRKQLLKIIEVFIQRVCSSFFWYRFKAVAIKEFIQLRRDHVTFGMIIGLPLMQLFLFGFAINTNPKHLPTVVLAGDYSAYTRTFLYGLKNTQYFDISEHVKSEKAAKNLMESGKTQFIISIPVDFTRKLLRGEQPELLIEADATDPVATGSAISAITNMVRTVFIPDLQGNNAYLSVVAPPINLVTHTNYNPESITRYNIVPGILGVVLTMTLVIIAAACITREREKGTLEHLLATPVTPLEVLLGSIMPYVMVGYVQVTLVLFAIKCFFNIPFQGSAILLIICALPFIAANLAVGMTFSSFSKNQLQSVQMATFFFLPSIMLSGFMFPFYGMPKWAQMIGSLLPLTYFLRIIRGIILKGNTFLQVWPNLWPILVFMVIALAIGLKRYHKTLD
jgi:ABC-2 type transport system permease protein